MVELVADYVVGRKTRSAQDIRQLRIDAVSPENDRTCSRTGGIWRREECRDAAKNHDAMDLQKKRKHDSAVLISDNYIHDIQVKRLTHTGNISTSV